MFLIGFLITNYFGHALDTGTYFFSNRKIDSAISVSYYMSRSSLAATLIVSLIIGMSVYKDFLYNTFSITFSSVSSKFNYLIGRFFGAFSICLLICVAPYIGFYLGIVVPWTSKINFGASQFEFYLYSFVFKTVPLLFFSSALFFCLSTVLKNTIFNWLVIILIYALSQFTYNIYANPDLESFQYLMALLDPLAIVTDKYAIKKVSMGEINSEPLPITQVLLINRLIYIGLGILILVFTYFKLNLFTRQSKFKILNFFRKKKIQENIDVADAFTQIKLPKISPDFSFKSKWNLWLRLNFSHIFRVLKNPFFIILLIAAYFYAKSNIRAFGSAWGTSSYPFTYLVAVKYLQTVNLFIVLTIIWFAGELLWRDRRYSVNKINDTYPVSNLFLLSTYVPILSLIPFFYYLLVVLLSIRAQINLNFHEYSFHTYAEIFLLAYPTHITLLFFTLFIFSLVQNKYLAIIVLILYYYLDGYLLNSLLPHKLLHFRGGSSYIYSDLTGYGGSLYPNLLFKFYWLAFSGIIIYFASKLWPRGLSFHWKDILKKIKNKGTKSEQFLLRISSILFLCIGSFIFYNIYLQGNGRISTQEISVEYEKKYNYLQNLTLPKVTDVYVEIDLYPETKSYEVKGYYWLKNKSDKEIKKLALNYSKKHKETSFSFSNNAINEFYDADLNLGLYHFETSLKPGDSIKLDYRIKSQPKGFSNKGVKMSISKNNTFLRNSILPSFGYNPAFEIQQNEIRKLYGLKPKQTDPPSYNDSIGINNSMLSRFSDFVNFEAIISTNENEIAITPGYLQKEWKKNDRAYYHYIMNKPIQNFYCFTSGKYKVKKENYKGVSLEIYYHKAHSFNIDIMLEAMKKSFDYYSKNFTPYQYNQLRIIEFPRYLGSFAQSFPNTVPFSESVGFTSDLRKLNYNLERDINDDLSLFDFTVAKRNIPLFVTAHEIAHQWWAHQIMSGDVEGSNFLIEALAQYSALRVIEEEYGHDQIKNYVKFELNRYLLLRQFETIKEEPLIRIRKGQQYIHYNKGAVVMNALRNYLGKNTVDNVLKTFLENNSYRDNPYTHAGELYKKFRAAAPDSLKYIVDDWLDDIILYDNQIKKATYMRTEDFDYEVRFSLDLNKFRDNGYGEETEVPLKDYITILIHNSEGLELYKEKIKFTDINKSQEFKLLINRKPDFITIDPDFNLVDKDLKDNTVKFKKFKP
ncbi:hypothetical protein BTO18_08800 [Polaribacter porphyrae]|uniref:Peptidase M1 membrane alanine aminopeptidase domain-containing protein n=2 Tax=Polaribacter porphyrae TaxID=1137780 RepID=A0A2S7WNU9_9FLAO|nr:hypothetical protein BTO18_08800 [Polaribacter porphyrae]